MSTDLWLTFVLFSAAAIASPGPAVLLAVTQGARHGGFGALPAILGNATGVAMVATASAFGVGTLFASSAVFMDILRVVGGAYLIWLGWRQFQTKTSHPRIPDLPQASVSIRRRYATGVGVALSNPKALLFFGALFPQFLDHNLPLTPQLAILTITFLSISFCFLTVCAAVAGKALLGRNRKAGKWASRISGTVFMAFGAGLIGGLR